MKKDPKASSGIKFNNLSEITTNGMAGLKTQGLFSSPQARQDVEKELEKLKQSVKN